MELKKGDLVVVDFDNDSRLFLLLDKKVSEIESWRAYSFSSEKVFYFCPSFYPPYRLRKLSHGP